ncbi:MAG: hypothetical protein QF489_00405 [Planctomycetota bacterium]|nr:hypothetical protein [Planctomycetota bacterium]
MSAGRNIAIGCGVIILAIFLAGFLGIRWFMNNFGATWDSGEIAAWSEELIGMTPPGFKGVWGSYASENQDEALLVFKQTHERGTQTGLTLYFRQGSHDFDSVMKDVDNNKEGIYIKFDSPAGEPEKYFATWRNVKVPIQLLEGYDETKILGRQITAIVPFDDHIVAMFIEGNAEYLDRDIVQELLDLIPADWQAKSLPTRPDELEENQ